MSQWMVPLELLEHGREVVAKATSSVAAGASLVHCQLVVSQLYEALKLELRRTPGTQSAKIDLLAVVLQQCRRSAEESRSPAALVAEFRKALDTLESWKRSDLERRTAQRRGAVSGLGSLAGRSPTQLSPRPGLGSIRPRLYVIRGGRAEA